MHTWTFPYVYMYRLFTFVNRKRRMQTCWQFPLRFTPRFMKECMRVHLGIYACTLRNVCVHTYNICIHASFLHMRVHLQHIYACTLTTYLCVYTYNLSMRVHLQNIYTCIDFYLRKSSVQKRQGAAWSQCVAVCFTMLQCVAVCCSVLQCVAVCKNAKAPSELIHVCTCVCICKCICDCRAIKVEFSQEQDRQTM